MALVEPRLLHPPRVDHDIDLLRRRDRAKVQIIQRAAQYQEVEHHPAFRDWVAYITRWKTQLEEDLQWGSLRRSRAFGTTDDEVRAMLYVLRLVLDIPAEAHAAYDRLRTMEDAAATAREKAESRLGFSHEGD